MRVASYNVLATAYIKPEYYPDADEAILNRSARHPALVQRVLGLSADVYCLQEVDAEVLASLQEWMPGYTCRYLPKGRGRPDGCATLIHGLEVVDWREVVYSDRSGHVALILETNFAGRRLALANTHVKWDPSGTPLGERHGYLQILDLLQTLCDMDCDEWIVCGDFNVTPRDELVRCLREAGLNEAFDGLDRPYTFVSKGKARKIDYIFHSAGLEASPEALPRVSALPSEHEPSDHLPLVASFQAQ